MRAVCSGHLVCCPLLAFLSCFLLPVPAQQSHPHLAWQKHAKLKARFDQQQDQATVWCTRTRFPPSNLLVETAPMASAQISPLAWTAQPLPRATSSQSAYFKKSILARHVYDRQSHIRNVRSRRNSLADSPKHSLSAHDSAMSAITHHSVIPFRTALTSSNLPLNARGVQQENDVTNVAVPRTVVVPSPQSDCDGKSLAAVSDQPLSLAVLRHSGSSITPGSGKDITETVSLPHGDDQDRTLRRGERLQMTEHKDILLTKLLHLYRNRVTAAASKQLPTYKPPQKILQRQQQTLASQKNSEPKAIRSSRHKRDGGFRTISSFFLASQHILQGGSVRLVQDERTVSNISLVQDTFTVSSISVVQDENNVTNISIVQHKNSVAKVSMAQETDELQGSQNVTMRARQHLPSNHSASRMPGHVVTTSAGRQGRVADRPGSGYARSWLPWPPKAADPVLVATGHFVESTTSYSDADIVRLRDHAVSTQSDITAAVRHTSQFPTQGALVRRRKDVSIAQQSEPTDVMVSPNHSKRSADIDSLDRKGGALYFSGQQVLKLRTPALATSGRSLPSNQFSLEVWVRPEGGQFSPAVIVALWDACGGPGRWSLSLGSSRPSSQASDTQERTESTLFFTLHGARAQKASVLWALERYRPLAWTHVMVTYNGSRAALYVNGARVATSRVQAGPVFQSPPSPCKVLTVGGLPNHSLMEDDPQVAHRPNAFRGTIARLNLWSRALNAEDVRERIALVLTPAESKSGDGGPGDSDRFLADGLAAKDIWLPAEGEERPSVAPQDVTISRYDLTPPVPLCGQTVCDSAPVVMSYAHNWQLRWSKIVRYRVINVMNDDGTRPTVSQTQLEQQHAALNAAFSPYNISFVLHEHRVTNSSLRQRLVMFGCQRQQVGDRVCQRQCVHTLTGRDGGDCDPNPPYCPPLRRGNGRCDLHCNNRRNNWDDGDCCLPGNDTHYTCYDPSSVYRAYLSVEELKELVALPNDRQLNVFIAVCSDWSVAQQRNPNLIGLSTFPWDKHVYSIHGGTVIQHQTFGTAGQMDSLVHELGHNLGLWHVHHGVSELQCGDPCLETQASLQLGDLCADTAPTSHNVHCSDPVNASDACGLPATFIHTPYSNYMSYADDLCTDHFTEQQVARMHCYLDLVYQSWQVAASPPPVPLPPRVVAAEREWALVAWTTPLGSRAGNGSWPCDRCDHQGAIVQFAVAASSPAPSSPLQRWGPNEATGPPDAEPCVPSTHAWMPDTMTCSRAKPCRLDLVLHVPVVAHQLKLWVTWNADGVKKIRLVYTDGTFSAIKVAPAFCDMPFTVTLTQSKPLRQVQVYTRTPFTAIDALAVETAAGQPDCQRCQTPTYRLFRTPPSSATYFRTTTKPFLLDREVEAGQRYQYWVVVEKWGVDSQPSPLLQYTHGQHFCGDGHVDSEDGEECDDSNILSGDGCDVNCRMETAYHCTGSPSACYRHLGDGLCEEFERERSVEDCGFFTPPVFFDQWAAAAFTNPADVTSACPAHAVIGHPPLNQHCGSVVDPAMAWSPCAASQHDGQFWIQVSMSRAVVATEVIIHLASDGRTPVHPEPKSLSVHLLKEDNSSSLLTSQPVVVDCMQPEVHIAVVHNLSSPFFRSKGVRVTVHSPHISIAAVRLRSHRFLDPVSLASCSQGELFSPHTGLCLPTACPPLACPPPALPNAQLVCTGHTEGQECTAHCRQGYIARTTPMSLRCSGGHWTSPQPLECLPLDCGQPVLSGLVARCAHGTRLGSNCTLHCQPPARVHGGAPWITCEKDGLWSAPAVQCLVTCSPPSHVQHVQRLQPSCRTGALPVGTQCKMRCSPGYRVDGARRMSRKVFRLTCTNTGQWTGGRCIPVTCPPLPAVFTHLASCTARRQLASRCTLTCPRHPETQTVTCLSGGRWSSELQPCAEPADVTCARLEDHPHLLFFCASRTPGSQCKVRCVQPHMVPVVGQQYDVSIPTTPVLQAGALIKGITCTYTGQWFPPLEQIECKVQCNKEFIKDEFCDGVNNWAHCAWDGGDCCESTLGGPVRPFPDSCRHCHCRDPRAAENLGRA